MNKKTGGGLGETVYDSAATFGRIMAFFGMLSGCVVGIILLSIGIYLMRHKASQTEESMAKIVDSKCTIIQTGTDKQPSQTTQCNMIVSYKVSGKEYKTNLVTNGRNYALNETISIQYNPNNPSDIREKAPTNKTIGIVLLLVGLGVMIVSIVWFIITLKYKIAAAGQAAYTVGDAIF